MPETTTPTAPYGFETPKGPYTSHRYCVGEVRPTMAGNVAVRVGREHTSGGWQQRAYIVLTPDEARAVAAELTRNL